MILIFGGAYQGKLSYALERFGLSDSDVYRCGENETTIPGGATIIYGLEKWLLALAKAGADSADAVRRFAAVNDGAIVICDDITCGVVPIDQTLREWREVVGRTLAELTRGSDEVVRLFCGIPMRIK